MPTTRGQQAFEQYLQSEDVQHNKQTITDVVNAYGSSFARLSLWVVQKTVKNQYVIVLRGDGYSALIATCLQKAQAETLYSLYLDHLCKLMDKRCWGT